MKTRIFILFFLPFSYLFSLNVGVIGIMPSPRQSCCLWNHDLIVELQKKGHTAEFIHLYTKIYPRNTKDHPFQLESHEKIMYYTNDNSLDEYDILITSDPRILRGKDKKKAILMMAEPAMILSQFGSKNIYKEYKAVFTWDHVNFNGKNIQKAFYAVLSNQPRDFIPFNDRNLCCQVCGYLSSYSWYIHELYSSRRKIAEFYDKFHPESFEFYGMRGWNRLDIKCYKGSCPDKPLVLSRNKFTYCYENNTYHSHYITEKILHCFVCKTVPIYLGCKNITDYIPKETFIDARDFKSIADIHNYISTMDEDTWLGYINAIRKFVDSEDSRYFKRDHYVFSLLDAIER